MTIPNLVSYDPAFAYEIAVIVRDGIRRMYADQEDVFYYLTLTNQNYNMPPMPTDCEEGIIRGMYAYSHTENAEVNLLGSGAIMAEVLVAAETLRAMGRRVSVWSVTSYSELARQGSHVERQELLTVGSTTERPYVATLLEDETGIFVAASDYLKTIPQGIARWLPGDYTVLGTDGFGLSESRESLRDHFEVSSHWIVFSSLSALARTNRGNASEAFEYAETNNLDLSKVSADMV